MKLVCGKQQCDISEEQAQSRLQIQKAMGLKGWELPEDSPYEFKNNVLIKRTDTKNSPGSKKSKGDTGGNKPPRKAEVSHRDDAPKG
jgi:hypothetical protein